MAKNIETFGSFESIKGAIEEEYKQKLASVTFEADQRMLEFEKKYTEEVHRLHTMKTSEIKNAAQSEFENLFMQGHIGIREDYESYRETLINQAMKKLRETLKKKVLSQKYVRFVKNTIKGEKITEVRGHSPSYKKHFSKIIKDTSIKGLVITCGNKVYDLTVDRLYELEHDRLREELYKEIFPSEVNKQKLTEKKEV